MNSLDGQVALVTGAASGIGAVVAEALAAAGATVVRADVNVASEDFARLDVTREEDWDLVVDHVHGRFGALDVLVNCAGIQGGGDHADPEHTPLQEWRRVHAVNLDGTFLGCRAVLPGMRARRRGSIINISSIVTRWATPNSVAYGSSKAAVQHFTKSVASYGARDGCNVRCNSVHPGMTHTPMIEGIIRAATTGGDADATAQRLLSKVPMGRFAQPEDVAALVTFLASPESSYITGSEFEVDGGWHLHSK